MSQSDLTRMAKHMQNGIPAELKTLRQWVMWRYEGREEQKTKVPYTPDGQHARSNDQTTWNDYQSCIDALPRFDGVGIMFANGLVGIDLDHHVDVQGQLTDFARRVVAQLPTYWEISPSGHGLHALCFGALPQCGRKNTEWQIEMYSAGRFFTVTGAHLEGTPEMVAHLSNELAELHQWVFRECSPKKPHLLAAAPTQPNDLDDSDLIDRAMQASNGIDFGRLWRGDTSAHGGDDSSADLALCNHLAFWTGNDVGRIDALFRQSGLMRSKWDERHASDGRTYGRMTIDKAISGTTHVYELYRRNGYDSAAIKVEDNQTAEPFQPIDNILECLHRQEAGDAELLAKMYSGRILYDRAEKRWYVWEGHSWAPDKQGRVIRLVYTEVASQYQYAAAIKMKEDNRDLAAELGKRACSLRFQKRITNVLGLAGSVPEISITGDQWDSEPMVLGVANGVIDLRTGTFRPGQPTDFIRTASPIEWQGIDAPCPRWEQFQREIHGDDEDIIDFMWRWRGYSISGLTDDHVIVIEWGEDGRNGKGTELETLKVILGDLAMATNADAIMDIRDLDGNAPRPFVFNLRGKRLVWASEMKEGRKLDTALVKYLTGGDTITARTLHGQPVSFRPTHKITLITNPRPRIEGSDDATWERIRLVPYEQRFVDEPQGEHEHPRDPKLMDKLKAEAPGILAWLVRGCLEWQKSGLAAPRKVMAATSEYRRGEDHLEQFCDDEIEDADQEMCVGFRDLWQRYENWCGRHDQRDKMVTKTKFGKRFSKKYRKETQGKNDTVFYYGLRLTTRKVLGD
jgi:putative DNA primase/helicase